MSTLLNYKDGVAAKGFDSATLGTTLTLAINAARLDLLNERRWGFLEAVGNSTLTTTVGQATVATAGVADLLYLDAVRMERAGQGYTLQPLALQDFRALENLDRTNGVPLYWTAISGARPTAIRLGPRPDLIYTLIIDYVKTAADLVNDGDTDTVIPDAFRNAVIWKAAENVAGRLRQYDFATYAEKKYGIALLKLEAADNILQRQSSDHVKSSGFWDAYDAGVWI